MFYLNPIDFYLTEFKDIKYDYLVYLVDKNLYYLVLGLAITYITITIPVELNGNWVTLLWGAESVLLFWIGRTKKVNFYEYFSYPLIILTFLSLAKD